VELNDHELRVRGPRGELTRKFHPDMRIVVGDGEIRVERPSDQREHRALHGLTRTLIANMVTGVTTGFERRLEVNGVGYRAGLSGRDLILQVGFSHPVYIPAPPGVTFAVEPPNRIVVSGPDKEVVGEWAARIRRVRPPEPYKGKGIKYLEETIRRKAGKTGGAKKK
jgi:large subunit ribosomal protein L6